MEHNKDAQLALNRFKDYVAKTGVLIIGSLLLAIGLKGARLSLQGGAAIASSVVFLCRLVMRFTGKLSELPVGPSRAVVGITILLSAGITVACEDVENKQAEEQVSIEEEQAATRLNFDINKAEILSEIGKAIFDKDFPNVKTLLGEQRHVQDEDLEKMRAIYADFRLKDLAAYIEREPDFANEQSIAVYTELSRIAPTNPVFKSKLRKHQVALAGQKRAEEAWDRKNAERARNCRPDTREGFVMAQAFVKDRLKAPATAKFAHFTDGHAELTGTCGEVRVTSYVDSQNSFGAMLRTHYTAVVKKTGDDKWAVVKINTSD